MAITADRAGCAIRRGNDKSRIELYRSFLPHDGMVGGATIDIRRDSLIADIQDGKRVITLFQRDGQWVPGAEVRRTSAGYLRTEPDDIAEDNLGALPEF